MGFCLFHCTALIIPFFRMISSMARITFAICSSVPMVMRSHSEICGSFQRRTRMLRFSARQRAFALDAAGFVEHEVRAGIRRFRSTRAQLLRKGLARLLTIPDGFEGILRPGAKPPRLAMETVHRVGIEAVLDVAKAFNQRMLRQRIAHAQPCQRVILAHGAGHDEVEYRFTSVAAEG